MIVIIDYGMGNLRSVENSLKKLGIKYKISGEKKDIYEADGLILPGVGAFRDAMENLQKRRLIIPIREKVKEGYPFLGICLGMQMLYEAGYECERSEGLGFLQGSIKLMEPKEDVKIPHIGWNRLEIKRNHKILKDLSKEAYVYFVHSYYVPVCEYTTAETEYILPFSAALHKDNFYASQFHIEKSGAVGEDIFNHFLSL